ncbi:glycosyltransferase [Latilactobacillus graminis]|uniref:Glycosyl transferases group 1 family protein n=2 Tax=Latilactobacillus graminis TaxID=60519 RepID=A0AA89L0F9_9LACO|nr:glycosyltransferase [Latilactobacillus graminis]KRM22429.1 glycosyl transferases group 1 family protein [Latilactobacillus graminis DSM 20719]QFP79401.1 glycosyltransferase family 4 protein [Latilactobacillus graminis]
MKVLLYFESEKLLAKSGIGRALDHQKRALSAMGIDFTLDPNDQDYDLLHINTYGLKSRSVIRKARKMGKPVIYHAHSTEEDFRNSFIGSNQLAPLVKRYLVSLYKQADHLITPTLYAKSLLESYGLTNPIAPISNGIDLAKYQPSAAKETAFRNYFHLQPDQKVIICVGLFFKRKGLIDFVEIAKSLPEYTFIWFGAVPMYSIPQNIRQIVKHNHPDNVIFPGYISGEIIEGAYGNADLFFFPSYEETEGIVVLEALASRQKVLVRDIPVYQGWLVDRQNCYMGHTNAEFRQLIQAMVNETVPNLTDQGYQIAKAKQISKIGQELQAVYQHVLTPEKANQQYTTIMKTPKL